MDRNGWQLCSGIGGTIAPEYAEGTLRMRNQGAKFAHGYARQNSRFVSFNDSSARIFAAKQVFCEI